MTHRIMAHTMKAIAALSAVTLTMGLAACGGGVALRVLTTHKGVYII